MTKTYTPHPYQRSDKRKQQICRLTQVEAEETIEELKNYFPYIQFWSHSFFKVQPHTVATKFRIYTRKRLSKRKTERLIEQNFPVRTRVKFVKPYNFTHSIDIITSKPMRWDDFMINTIKTFGDYVK